MPANLRFHLFAMLLMLSACVSSDRSSGSFSDSEAFQLFRTLSPEESGLQFENKLVENERINILNYLYYYNGSGVAAGDINNDGLPDLYFAATVGRNKLFLNRGNMQFEEVTERAGVGGDYGITTGVSMVDLNNDGYLDIYVCKSGFDSDRYRTNELFINNGDANFTEMSEAYGLNDPSFSNQAYFFDMDGDEDLDLYLVNHPIDWPNINKIMTGAQEMDGFDYRFSDKLYRNDGNGHFEDITRAAGLLNRSWGLSAAIGDFNGDQRPDIYVANDFIKPDNLYINNGDGTFTDQLQQYFRHISFYSMGSDFADINNDLRNDLYVADMAMSGHARSKRNMGSMSTENFQTIIRRGYHYPYAANNLHLNLGKQGFSEIAQAVGVNKTDWSWAPLLVDLDNDGHKDLFVTNGIYRDIIDNDFLQLKKEYDQQEEKNYYADLVPKIPQTKVKNKVFRNRGDLHFTDLGDTWGITQAGCSNGAAYVDLDMDGDIDLVVNNLNEPSIIYENQTIGQLDHHYLKVQLTGPAKNPGAIGAQVEIRYGDQQQRLDVQPNRGYLSSVDPVLHFGIGRHTQIDELTITWPNGKHTRIQQPEIDRVLKLAYAEVTSGYTAAFAESSLLFHDITQQSGIDFLHRSKSYDDFDQELLLPHKLSEFGPYLAVADVNLDGLEDFFVGGTAGNEAVLYLQNTNGTFTENRQTAWANDRDFEDQRSIFFDADQDGDPDLYVVSGSNEFTGQYHYQDRLYLNDGKGAFQRATDALPRITASGMAVDAADFDGDGDLDLAVGGRVVPGRYPTTPRSYLLENKQGKFTDVTEQFAPELQQAGMVTDLEWTDYDQDGDPDLMVVGEWMPVVVFENEGGQLKKLDVAMAGLAHTAGWWFSLTAGDVDGDGDPDYLLGNLGENNKYHPKAERPLHIYYDDFDKNGSGDIVLSKAEAGTLYPVRGRECSSQQMPFIADKFPDFKSFAAADLETIYTTEQLAEALHLQVEEFRSGVLINEGGGRFRFSALPLMAQISPVMGAAFMEVNGDASPDLLIAGNFHAAETETIRYDAGSGLCLLNEGAAQFSALDIPASNFFAPGDVRDLQLIQLANGATGILISKNDDRLQLIAQNEKPDEAS